MNFALKVRNAAQNVLAEATQVYGHTRRLLLRMASSELTRWIGEYKLLQEAAAQLRASKSRSAISNPSGLVADASQQHAASLKSEAGVASVAAPTSIKLRKDLSVSSPPSDHQSQSDEDEQPNAPDSAHKQNKTMKNSSEEAIDPLDAEKIRLEHEILVCLFWESTLDWLSSDSHVHR